MSKVAEQKALEAYPIKIDRIYYGLPLLNGAEPFTDDVNIQQRNAYIQGYDQAFQDIKEFIYDKFNIHPHDCHVVQYDSDTPLESMDDFIKQIENYIKNESEN